MGTRGFITFAGGGKEKTAYNHWDSYPDGLGLDMLRWLRGALANEASLRVQVEALRVVDPQSSPAAEDIERFRQFSWNREQHGGDRDLREGQEWYDLLHETQGKPALILEAGVIEDASDFPRDSLFAEYGYVVDLDARTFEAYEGFQRSPHQLGRFADRGPRERGYASGDTYYPVALVASWSFDLLPDDAAFAAAFGGDEDGDGES